MTAAWRHRGDANDRRLLPPQMLELSTPESVTPGLLVLVSPDAPTRAILCAGAGTFARAHVTLTRGLHIGAGADAAERVAAHFADLQPRRRQRARNGSAQAHNELAKAMAAAR